VTGVASPSTTYAGGPLHYWIRRIDSLVVSTQQTNETDGVCGYSAIGYCSVVRSKQVEPSLAINMYKVESTKDYFMRFVAPRGIRMTKRGAH